MLQFKNNVRLSGVQEEILFIIDRIQRYFEVRLPKRDFVITSLTDGVHMKGSLHPKGLALDMRSRTLDKKEIEYFVTWFRKNFEKSYDLVVEIDHIHIEYDPK